jgi:4-amino-4-deoxy-L-arabinose transferase-like glycosyltransferase
VADALGAHRRAVAITATRVVIMALVLLGAYFALPLDRPGSVFWQATLSLVLLGGVLAGQAVLVIRSTRPRLQAVESLAVAVVLLLVLSAATYLRLSHVDPEAFTEVLDHVGALYLAMMTLTTVGFGDIGALSRPARVAVMVQMVANLAVVGIAARVIVHLARSRSTAETDG